MAKFLEWDMLVCNSINYSRYLQSSLQGVPLHVYIEIQPEGEIGRHSGYRSWLGFNSLIPFLIRLALKKIAALPNLLFPS